MKVIRKNEPIPAGEMPESQSIWLLDGVGWGTGEHETTLLCLQAIGLLLKRHPLHEQQVLDFGSGSGLLSIAAARRGAAVEGVEIEEAAILHAQANARLNGVEDRIRFTRQIESGIRSVDFVVANILRPVLLQFAPALTRVLRPGGTLVLSGLVATDLPEVTVRYSTLLGGRTPEIFRRGEWRALVWR